MILESELTYFVQNTTGLFQYCQSIMYKTEVVNPKCQITHFDPLSMAIKITVKNEAQSQTQKSNKNPEEDLIYMTGTWQEYWEYQY